MNLILLRNDDFDDEERVTLADARARHVLTVLRSRPGDRLRVGRLNGPLGQAEVLSLAAGRVSLRCRFNPTPPPRPRIDLLLALPRPKVLKRLWAQLSAIGVRRILLSNAERVERDYFDTHVLEPETYEPLLIEGLQQAQDTWMPAVSVHKRFRVLVEDELDGLSSPDGARFVAHADARHDPPGVAATTRQALVAIGPEGGWNAFELDLLQGRGFQRISLGARTLRVDTACVALLSRLHDALASAGEPENGQEPRP